MIQPLIIAGALGSPYTRKMLALLRYRRRSYRFVTVEAASRLPAPRVPLLPVIYFEDEGVLEASVDSTPVIRRLEAEVADRGVVPTDPALAFLDALIEDYADEWLTKPMFHYRWSFAADIARSAAVLPLWFGRPLTGEKHKADSAAFAERQIGRLSYVGSNAVTAPTIEGSFVRLVDLLERRLTEQPFILGPRPGAGDFALFGQLSQLALFDPTPSAIVAERAPRLLAWTMTMDDLSGLEPPAWSTPADLRRALRPLFFEMGRTYAPLLLANAKTVEAGGDAVEIELDGAPWSQSPFPYQVKCLLALRTLYAGLDAVERRRVDDMLSGTGCEALFAPV